MRVEQQHLSPAGLFSTRGLSFTQVVTSAPGKTLWVSGQTAWNADRKLVGGSDLGKQAEQALANLRTALEAAGATPRDVVFHLRARGSSWSRVVPSAAPAPDTHGVHSRRMAAVRYPGKVSPDSLSCPRREPIAER
jgi:hypothetical protein